MKKCKCGETLIRIDEDKHVHGMLVKLRDGGIYKQTYQSIEMRCYNHLCPEKYWWNPITRKITRRMK